MKADAGVVGHFLMQGLEKRGSFRSARLERPKCRPVSLDAIAIAESRMQRFEHLGCSASTFDDEGADRAETVSPGFPHYLSRDADPGTDRLVQCVEPRSRVQQIALSSVFQPRPGSDVADNCGPSMNAYPGMAKIDAAGPLLGAEAVSKLVYRQGGTDGSIRVVYLRERCAEKCEHGVADELVHHAA